MDRKQISQSLKEASSCIRKFEAESKTLKEKLAKSQETTSDLQKEAEALKIAMELILDEATLAEVNEKVAVLKTKDLKVVKEALELDLTKKTAGIGELYDSSGDARIDMSDPTQAFMAILKGNK